MRISKVGRGMRVGSIAIQVQGGVMAGVAAALLAIPPPASAQVPAAIIKGLGWIGEQIGVAAIGGAVVEGGKALLGIKDCPHCDERLAAVQAELERQVKASNQVNSTLTTELEGVRAEIRSIQALRAGEVQEAKSHYEQSMSLLAMVPSLHDQVVAVRADVEAFKTYIGARMDGVDEHVRQLEADLRVANQKLDDLIRRDRANGYYGADRGTVTSLPTQSYYPPQWPTPVAPFPPVRPYYSMPPYMAGPHPALPWGRYYARPRICVRRNLWVVAGPYGRPSLTSTCVAVY